MQQLPRTGVGQLQAAGGAHTSSPARRPRARSPTWRLAAPSGPAGGELSAETRFPAPHGSQTPEAWQRDPAHESRSPVDRTWTHLSPPHHPATEPRLWASMPIYRNCPTWWKTAPRIAAATAPTVPTPAGAGTARDLRRGTLPGRSPGTSAAAREPPAARPPGAAPGRTILILRCSRTRTGPFDQPGARDTPPHPPSARVCNHDQSPASPENRCQRCARGEMHRLVRELSVSTVTSHFGLHPSHGVTERLQHARGIMVTPSTQSPRPIPGAESMTLHRP